MKREIIIERNEEKGKMTASFHYQEDLIRLIKRIPGAEFDPALKVWNFPERWDTLTVLFDTFKGIAWIDISQLVDKRFNEPKKVTKEKYPELPQLDEHKEEELDRFVRYMFSKRYSESTVRVYSDAMRVYLRFHYDKEIEELTNQDLIRFNNEYILAQGLSRSFQNQVVNAIRLFYRKVRNHSMELDQMERPKNGHYLPVIFSVSEVEKLFSVTENLKHRLMLMMIYSSGLRRGELLRMEIRDIDSDRMVIHVREAKGFKDRIVPLSSFLLDELRAYYRTYRPKKYLFEGLSGDQYSERSLQHVFRAAVQKAGIKKECRLHTLRHSYATHLLESGVNLRYIQELLGHKSPKTTEIYTHVSSEGIRKVESPLDRMFKNKRT
ncbi:MAG: integrase [Bacteroidetes bacterium]|nr:MAG: integrase [Bacteroidota bacterium]